MNQPQSRSGLVFLCCADGEGSHEFRVAADQAGVMAFYEEMFGPDSEGKMDSAIEHFRDPDNWFNDRTAYSCKLYCATFKVWKVDPREINAVASETQTRLAEAAPDLLAALERIVHLNEQLPADNPARLSHGEEKQAVSAINKARGL